MTEPHPLATPADPDGYRATALAVRNLFRRQALTIEQAWALLLQAEDGPSVMPEEERKPTRGLLMEFGYREFQVTPVGGDEASLLWIRPDWLPEAIEELPLD